MLLQGQRLPKPPAIGTTSAFRVCERKRHCRDTFVLCGGFENPGSATFGADQVREWHKQIRLGAPCRRNQCPSKSAPGDTPPNIHTRQMSWSEPCYQPWRANPAPSPPR